MKKPFQILMGILAALMLALTACAGVSDADAVETIVAGTLGAPTPTQPVEATATVGSDAQGTPAAEATASPEPAAGSPDAPEPNVLFEDIAFYLDYTLASSWGYEITSPPISQNPGPPGPNPYQDLSLYRLDFQGFSGMGPDDNRPWRQPVMFIIPVANMQSFPGGGYGLDVLGYYDGLLDFKPPTVTERMPILPETILTGQEAYHGNLKYLDFQNGSGVRFVAEYAQAPFPLGNGLAYYFQGITSDGKYFVSLALPVEETALEAYNAPVNSSLEAGEWEAFGDNFVAYMQGASAILNAAPDSSFTPDLARLDEMVESLNVRP